MHKRMRHDARLEGFNKPLYSHCEKLAAASLLSRFAIVIGILGLLLCTGGVGLTIIFGSTAHLSIFYVGIALLLVATLISIACVQRVVVTNRRLKMMGITASDFTSKWNTADQLLSPHKLRSTGHLEQVNNGFVHPVKQIDPLELRRPPRSLSSTEV
ncbi:unnamed protein product [Dicrocoelium dendriticum]|nr:unnamed protein product [Dicrocoelium dendriticum]